LINRSLSALSKRGVKMVDLKIALEFDNRKSSLCIAKGIQQKIATILKNNQLKAWNNELFEDFIKEKIKLNISTRHTLSIYGIKGNPQNAYNEIMVILDCFSSYITYKYLWLN